MSESLRSSESSESKKPAEEEMAKVKYWDKFAKQHLSEMRLLFRGGKLWQKEGWRNVVEHSLPQGAATEILSEMLQLSEKDKKELIRNAICHDWNKRLEIKPEDLTDEDQKKALSFMRRTGLDPELIAATSTDFAQQIVASDKSGKNIPIMQLLMFYVDQISLGGKDNPGGIVSFKDRVAEVRERHPELDSEHWDSEIKAGQIAQNKISGLLREKGVLIERAEDLPELIRNTIEKKYSEHKE